MFWPIFLLLLFVIWFVAWLVQTIRYFSGRWQPPPKRPQPPEEPPPIGAILVDCFDDW